jgi:Spy/CpxP family protein refolding chaperone
MNMKQLFATGFLAMVIVASVAFMPADATGKNSNVATADHAGRIAPAQNATELPQDQVRDLTYN